MPRLQKFIASFGQFSRREAERLIAEGKVVVNGKKITEQGVQVEDNVHITIDGKPLEKSITQSYLLNKPKGYVCSRAPQGKSPIVTDLVPKNPSVYPIGRLDKDSEGLILLSNNGDLTYRLTHPKFEHRKEYQVFVTWKGDRPNFVKIEKEFRKGVRLGDGVARADSIKIKPLDEQNVVIYMQVHEGRHHLIRRMCTTQKLEVKRLVRIRIGHLKLGSLKPGAFRILKEDELRLFYDAH